MKNDSKITRAERTLEKTVQQAEFIAGQIAKNAADGCFVACPECGQLIPTPYSGFISREAADRYALDHCDCQQVKTRITAANKGGLRMTEINQEIENMIAEMRVIGQLPAPCRRGNRNNLIKYQDLKCKILERFLS